MAARSVGVGVAIVLLALAIRLVSLGTPHDFVFDERYYAMDAYAYLGGTIELGTPGDPVKIDRERTWEHPPLGKLLIAVGEGPVGLRPWGWRMPSALAGTAGVLIVYVMALQLWGSGWAALAALLVSLDGFQVVQSRMAMLDIFQSTLLIAAVSCLIRSRKDLHGKWLVAAGACFGAATAVKWSSASVLVLAVAAVAVRARRQAGAAGSRTMPKILLALVVVPVAVYVASYAEYWIEHGPAVRSFVTLQRRMALRDHYGYDEAPGHHPGVALPNTSPAWTWPLLTRPITYFDDGRGHRIVARGNPALWWSSLVLLPAIAVALVRRRRWSDLVIVGAGLALYAPWLVLGRPKYAYYLTPVAPFAALAVVIGLRAAGRTGRVAAWVVGSSAVAASILLGPSWIGWRSPWS